MSAAGGVSLTVAPTIVDGPWLDATIVYEIGVPATDDIAPSVLVIDRSAVGVNGFVSLAELSDASVSVTPDGVETVAVFVSVPVADASIVPVTVKVAVAPTGRSTVVAMSSEPVASVHVAPPASTHAHVTADRSLGIVSPTAAPTTSDGPSLPTTIVYVIDSPGAESVPPCVFEIVRSASGVIVSTSVAE